MAKRSAGGGWGPEEEERARVSVNRDLGLPYDYDPVTKRFQGDVLSEEERRQMASGRGMPQDRYGREAERYRGPSYAQDRPVPSRPTQAADRGWGPQGRYAGRGPRGYRRSDDRVREEVCDRLTVAGSVDATNIEVEVHNGEVRLMGSVVDRYQKRYAEDVALSVYGVEDVLNELRVEEQRGGEQGYRTQRQYQPQSSNREYRSREQPQTPRPEDWARQLRRGMEVMDIHGEFVGRVKEISQTEFLVNRRLARDVYIPFDAIRNVGEKVYIRMEDRRYGYAMTSW
jgi:hypothetical protein